MVLLSYHLQARQSVTLPTYEEIAKELEIQIASLDGEYTKLSNEISNEKKEIQREVDNAFNQMEKEIGEIKLKHHNILQKHLNGIKLLQSLMQHTLISLTKIGRSNEISSTMKYNLKNEEFRKLSPKIHVSIPKFISIQRENKYICSLIGKLTPLSTILEQKNPYSKKCTHFRQKNVE